MARDKVLSMPLAAVASRTASRNADARTAYLTANRTVMAFLADVDSAATTFAPGANFTPLASSLSPTTTSSASDFSAPLSTVSLPLMPLGAIGLPWSST